MPTGARAIALVVGLACLASACDWELRDAAYATLAEATADGAVQRGWIPAWLPARASNLHEVHDQDTSSSALAFELPATPRWSPPESCRPAQGGEFVEPGFDRAWLPDLRQDADAFDFFGCPNEVPFNRQMFAALAVRKDGRRVVYWRGYLK